jgi:hypothetical protein
MLCHDQAIPSISTYSASPFRQRRENTPFRFHSKKYLWMELALPNSFFDNAFHWQPVRNTNDDAFEDFPGLHGLAATSWAPRILPFFLAVLFRD